MFSYRNVAVCKRLVVELHFDKAADQPKSVHVFDRDSNDLPRKPGDQLVEINSGDGRFTVARKPIPGYKISIDWEFEGQLNVAYKENINPTLSTEMDVSGDDRKN